MTDPHEDLVEAVAREIWLGEPRRIGSQRKDEWADQSEDTKNRYRPLARAAIALIAERTKDATPEMLGHALYGFPLGEQWEKMHRASALWPKEKP